MPNDLLVTTTDILGIEVAKEYSGASGIYVDNENNVISITGEVGKEYNGIEPIVVNNEENLISANSAPIGVQEPLYFVQDDDEAVIIGLSGGQGDPEVNELVHSNSATWNEVSSKLDSTAYTPFDPTYMSGAIDGKLNTTAFSTVSGDFLTSVPEEYATKDFVSDSITGKLDSTAFSTVSSDFLVSSSLNGYATETFVGTVSSDITALIPDTSNFITNSSAEATYQTIGGMTAYQPAGEYITLNDFNYGVI